MNFRPIHDRVLVKRTSPREKTPGGLWIPDTAKEKPVEGEVVAVGPGSRLDDGTYHRHVKPGDRVLFAKWGGEEIQLPDGSRQLIMREADIIGILR